MESALYGIYTLVVFVSENSCVNAVRVIYISRSVYIKKDKIGRYPMT